MADYDFTKPISVKIEGKSPPMEGVDSTGATTYIPVIHQIHEGQAIPLERTPPKRRTKRRERAIDTSLSVGKEALYANLQKRNEGWAGMRPYGRTKRDKNLVS
jgi:hypothetical protein